MDEFTNEEMIECQQRINEIEELKKKEEDYFSTCSEAEQQDYVIDKYSKCKILAQKLGLNIVKVGK